MVNMNYADRLLHRLSKYFK